MPLDISETNLANFGTELETNIKAAAAENEAQWTGAGDEAGLKIWRIEQFAVVPWPKEEYGKFFTGDSYIVLKTEQNDNAKTYDVHFWLGKNTSQDEAGTAAYKTVELDDSLGGAAIQHREVQGSEGPKFLSYFPAGVRLQEGGVASGFRHVTEEEYVPQLFQVAKKKGGNITASQVALGATSLNSGDVFILDQGKAIWQWHGTNSSPFEKNKARELSSQIADENGGNVTVINQGEEPEEFWAGLGGQGDVQESEGSRALLNEEPADKKVFCLSEEEDALNFAELEGAETLASDNVFVVDVGDEVFVWIGTDSSAKEKRCGLHYAQKYITNSGKEVATPITAVKEASVGGDTFLSTV
eukprot:TRINITY_DN75139_c0_g1_i1.p1 TRINITY_DN75139_c0_g1~~TRINITY_DN75139_c0_g1_i1.p1  ORF type:complete len:374 (-),score=84.86 TRINITY_DN75139_c0_g1_i1:81-1151(-)